MKLSTRAKQKEYADANLQFLEDNKLKSDIVVLPSGVQYRIITQGEGPKPKINSIVQVFYKGYMIDGRQFDSNMSDSVPMALRLNEVIDGWQIALKEMPVGSHWEIYIPSNLGYGGQSAGIIRKYSTLIFEIKLIGIA